MKRRNRAAVRTACLASIRSGRIFERIRYVLIAAVLIACLPAGVIRYALSFNSRVGREWRRWRMRTGFVVAMFLMSGAIVPACVLAAPVEDEAHRLDRLETVRLNEAAAARLRASSPPVPAPGGPARGGGSTESPAEKALRSREEQAIAGWRARADRCHAGDRTACPPEP